MGPALGDLMVQLEAQSQAAKPNLRTIVQELYERKV